MKNQLHYLKLFLPVLLTTTALSSHAQEYTLTTTNANIIASKALIDLPGLSGNSNAIIIATPLGNAKTSNPHPLGAWYYSGKWNIFNSDHAVMPVGLSYKVEYFLNPGTNQFLHLVTQQNLGSQGSYIDNPALNNKPNVQFSIFQNHAPDSRTGSHLNQFEAKAGYSASAGKWYVTNIGGQPLHKGTAYNIVITSAGTTSPHTGPVPIDISSTQPCKCPAALPPNGLASGDLQGNYPDPMVRKILGRPLSNTAPAVGQVLKWNGTEWAPSVDAAGSGNGTTYTSGLGLDLTGTTFSALNSTAMWNASQLVGRDVMTTAPTVGQVLKWGGGSWYPADDNVGTSGGGTAIKSYYKYTSNTIGSWEISIDDANEKKIPSISGLIIEVAVASRFVVSANCYVDIGCPAIGACPLIMEFYYKVNNNATKPFSFAGAQNLTGTISNHFYDVAPGVYTIDFYSRKRLYYPGELNYKVAGGYVTVMVLPK